MTAGRHRADVLVVGAGVSGLTSAVCLAEAGLTVLVTALGPPARSTSSAAGALWGPYLADHPDLPRWAEDTRRTLLDLVTADAGVRVAAGMEVDRRAATPPHWVTGLPGYRTCAPGELPPGYRTGWRYTAPVLDMPTYLEYLFRRLVAAGGQVEEAELRSLAEVDGQAPVVVNCTGYGARRLVPDETVTAVRGQLVIVDNPGIDEFFADSGSAELTYLLPHGPHLVLGGSAEVGRWDTVPDPRTTEAILRRCAAIRPEVTGARVRDCRVGIRPCRDRVRLECVPSPGGHLIHNYGHGGGGISLSWGCARDVRRMVLALR